MMVLHQLRWWSEPPDIMHRFQHHSRTFVFSARGDALSLAGKAKPKETCIMRRFGLKVPSGRYTRFYVGAAIHLKERAMGSVCSKAGCILCTICGRCLRKRERQVVCEGSAATYMCASDYLDFALWVAMRQVFHAWSCVVGVLIFHQKWRHSSWP